MDRSAAVPLPRRVWIEIHGEDGTLLESVESRIQGATFITPLPAFEPGTRGTPTRCGKSIDGRLWREGPSEIQDFPDTVGSVRLPRIRR